MNTENRKPTVCLFSTAQTHDDVRMFYRESVWLAKAGYEVHMIVPSGQSGLRNGVNVHSFTRPRSRLTRMFIMPWFVMILALRTKSDIYHYHDPELLFIGFIMRWLLLKKVVFDMRESTASQLKAKGYLPHWSRNIISFCYSMVEAICLKGISVIVANDRSKEEHKNSYLVRNFPEINEQLMIKATDIDKRLEKPLLIYLGGVSEVRGALLYIELANQLKKSGYDFKMMIIGPDHTNCLSKLNSEVRELNLEDRVQIPGWMDYNEAMKLVSQAAIGMAILKPVPNYLFCLAGKMLEYMMCGTPVLCSDFDHWRPYVEGEKTGLMVDPDDMEEIVNACQKMLNDPNELSAMSKRGMEAVRSKYNWETEFNNLLKCYKDLLK